VKRRVTATKRPEVVKLWSTLVTKHEGGTMASLALVRDGDKGNPLGVASMADDGSDLSDALSQLTEQAEKFLETEKGSGKAKQEAIAQQTDEEDPEVQAIVAARQASAEPGIETEEAAPKGAKSTVQKTA